MIKRYTEQEIPDLDTRRAVNCYHAETPCNEKLFQNCKKEAFNLWRKCPKQSGKYREAKI